MRLSILFLAALFTCAAADPFCGTWSFVSRRVDPPTKLTYEVADNKLHFKSTAGTDETTPIDGADHPVAGADQTAAVRRIDERTLETTYKAAGKATARNTRKVSADGKEMTFQVAGQSTTTIYDRVGAPVAGADPFAGEWVYNPDKSNEPVQKEVRLECKDGLVRRFSEKGDIVWEAKLDGSAHQGPRQTITARRVDPNTVETTTTGQVKIMTRITVSPDGETMTYTADRLPAGNPSKTVVTYKRVATQ